MTGIVSIVTKGILVLGTIAALIAFVVALTDPYSRYILKIINLIKKAIYNRWYN